MESLINELRSLVDKEVNIISNNNVKTVTIVEIGNNLIRGVESRTGRVVLFPLHNVEIVEVISK